MSVDAGGQFRGAVDDEAELLQEEEDDDVVVTLSGIRHAMIIRPINYGFLCTLY